VIPAEGPPMSETSRHMLPKARLDALTDEVGEAYTPRRSTDCCTGGNPPDALIDNF
jgi:hypothetical protein